MRPDHILPPASLAAYIAFYGITTVGEDFYEPYVSPPLGFCGFIICLEGVVNATVHGRVFMKGPYCATGQVSFPVIGETKGTSKILMVFIQPCGLHQLFGIDMSLLTNTSMPLAELLGGAACATLIAQLKTAADNNEIVAVMNRFFLSRPVIEIHDKIKTVLDYIHERKGAVTVADIEHDCFITTRSLERYFSLYIGLSPREYARIYRFKCLMNYIREHPSLSWEKLCAATGYYDQAHITKDFTRYLTIKPAELENIEPSFLYFLLQQ